MSAHSRPLISGFTLVRNGEKFEYPYLESLRSLLAVVDELVINVGIGDDETLTRVKEFASQAPLSKKVILFESHWPLDDPEKKREGKILSEQTNLALEKCTHDWCIYLQADEVFHEDDAHLLRSAIARAIETSEIEALVFKYIHFYGSYDIIQETRSSYRREIRCIRKSSGAVSVGDAQSFRKRSGEKLKALLTSARVFHYGWVRSPEKMREKTFFMDQLYHGDPNASALFTLTPATGDNYRYKRFWGLKRFKTTHPAVMHGRISQKGWNWDFERSPFQFQLKDLKKIVLDSFESVTGIRLFEYKSYRLLK